MRLLCRLGLHKWSAPTDVTTRYSKGGILAGTVDVGRQSCPCGLARPIFKTGSLFAEGNWRPFPPADPRLWEAVFSDYMPFDELQVWRRERDLAQHAEKVGQPCDSCIAFEATGRKDSRWPIGTLRERRSDHTWRVWVGWRCDSTVCGHQGFSFYEEKSIAEREALAGSR